MSRFKETRNPRHPACSVSESKSHMVALFFKLFGKSASRPQKCKKMISRSQSPCSGDGRSIFHKGKSERHRAEIVVVAVLALTVEKLVHKEALILQRAEGMQIHLNSPLSFLVLCGLIIHFRPRKSSCIFS